MKITAIMLVAVLAAAGCSKKKDGGGGGACEETINGAADRMAAGRGSAPPPEMKQALDKLKAAIIKRCTEDKWSDEVLACYGKANTMPDMRACRGKLPPELGEKLHNDEMAVMQSMAGAGGPGMMHGAPPPAPPPPGAAEGSAPAPAPAPAPAAGSGK